MARTDNDTWDLASSVGATATMVAAARAMATTAENPLINDPFADPLVRAVGVDFFTRLVTGELRPEDLDTDNESVGMQRMTDNMAVRTKFFDDFFLTATGGGNSADATASGIRQAVILASGLDARAYRLAWPAGTTVYEIDQPEVIEFKTKTLAGLDAKPKADRRTIAIDLRNDWPKALLDNGFDPSQATAWIAEGLLIYLPPEAQDLLFDRINELSAPGSRVATEHIPDITMFSDERSEQIRERFKKYGHDIEMKDLVYHGERSHVIDYLAGHGWDVTAQKTPDAYVANGFEFPEDETMGFFADLSYVSAVKR